MTDPGQIRAWQRLGPDLTTSGRITHADVAALADLGVRHVINLAMADHPEALPDANREFAMCGIGYTHIPVPFDAPDDTHFTAFCAALASAPRPLHVHCIMNFRVSAFFYRWHRDMMGMGEAEARATMRMQWDPAEFDHPTAPAWIAFIAGSRAI